MILRRLAVFCASAVCFGLLATASLAGTVSGTVRNGTTGKPAAGVQVILIQLQGGMQPVANTNTDAQGHYQFDNPMLGTGPMLLRAVYRGVFYHEPATPGTSTVNIDVYEPTDKASTISVTAHAIIFQPGDSGLVVDEEYNIENSSQPPVAFYRPGGSFIFALPEGAQLGEVSAGGPSGMPVKQTPIAKPRNEEAIAYAFRPGASRVGISYTVPYPGNQARLQFTSRYTIGRVALFAPPSMQVYSADFSPAGQEQGFNVLMRESVAANSPISVSVSGTAPPPEAGAAAGDDSQNPSVNSRADSGAGVPTASVTNLPARLDSLKWIVVAGFAALFGLGLLFLWRQPQAAEAEAPPAPSSSPVSKRKPASARHAAAPEKSSPAAGADQIVRESLDELKDSLLRLELRREAGTISEEEYAEQSERVRKTLRGFVKG